MTDSASRADGRDASAADRDDSADQRDAAARERDSVAAGRETVADRRDEDARRAAADLDEQLSRIRRQLVDRLARTGGLPIDRADWPDLTPAGLARLRAFVDDQRHLAELDRTAVRDLVDELCGTLHHLADERRSATVDRRAATRDRDSAADDRRRSAQDRELSARDRDESAIERELAEPEELPVGEAAPAPYGLMDRVADALATSEQHLAASRAALARGGGRREHPARAPGGPDADEPGRTGAANEP